MALLGAFFFGFVPMLVFAAFVNWLDRYEKEPKLLLGAAFVWGVVIAGGGAYILNTVFGIGIYVLTGSESAADFGTTSIVAPIIEEALKGLAVGVVFLLFRKEFDSVLDGVVYGAITAMGFAAIENVLYIYRNGFQEGGWEGFWILVVVRVVLVGWMHPFFTAFTGIGFAVARMSRNMLVKIIAVPAGYVVAVLTHSFHNTFGSLVGGEGGFFLGILADYFGYFIMTVFIIWMIIHERGILKRQLMEEVNSGAISQQQYKTAISFFQFNAHISALTSGSFGPTKRFYQVLGELAHKKEQRARVGEESGNTKIIDGYRAELAQLAPLAKV
ncbi:MAG TPA: PrsW family intramembrane metalloprotease [Anaerolineales bacterium]|nr:PrsW family intramembrane metalloprotease [Anaerolineales bacterium]HMR98699.1 PrsW family intramembrane metalloprotease [Anaerolineales bacterium]HNQ93860.1 PrsW family intramembrane metalloprotease [Anaerolineales bacterium]HNS60246.1 PrsW family intramembrane metalloprotease [Anaerolineales bacterium]